MGARKSEGRQHVVFTLNGQRFAIDLARVDRISDPGPLAVPPVLHERIEGLVFSEGTIIEVINLRDRLSLPGSASEGGGELIVVKSREKLVGLRVDAVLGVTVIQAAAAGQNEILMPAGVRGLLASISSTQGTPVAILDVDEIVHGPERRHGRKVASP
jgi:purine-binding chemotaxis protein CheW